MAYNNSSGKGSEIYHLISPAAPKSDISTENLPSVVPPNAPKSRYWGRAIVLLLVPLSITAYYYWIWRYLLSRPYDDAIKFGSATEIWVYYSWFILGVVALEWSKHGLIGVEVAMLETKTFGAPHLVALLSHSEGTWSGPGGWFKCITKALKKNDSGLNTGLLDSLKTYKLWYLLAFISLSLYVAMPLSGLTMELSEGYVRLREISMVVGRNSTNFHERYSLDSLPVVWSAWKLGSPVTLPGVGIIFTPDYFNREGYDDLGDSPNILPTDQEIPEMFIVPQALGPISGNPWGLRVGYNCSIIEDVSKFIILGRQVETSTGCSTIESNASDFCATAQVITGGSNVWLYSEVGDGLNMKNPRYPDDTADNQRVNVLEWAVWQVRTPAHYEEPKNFTTAVGPIVQGISTPFVKASNGSWVTNATFFGEKQRKGYDDEIRLKFGRSKTPLDVAAAIGVQCVVRYAFGSAVVDARTSSFSGFYTQDPLFRMNGLVTGPRGVATTAGVEDIFNSLGARAIEAASNSYQLSRFVSSEELRKSAYLAFGHEVLDEMYDHYYGFEGSWPHANLTSSKKGKVLTKGELPPLVAVIPFGIWAVGSCVLGVLFGFKKRLADSLNGFSFFRFGVHSADKLKTEGILDAKEAEDVATLWTLPGTLEKRPGKS